MSEAKVTLAFMYFADFQAELAQRGITECRMQPMISVETLDTSTLPYSHVWQVVLSVWVPATAEVLVTRLYVGDLRSGFSTLHGYRGPQDTDLAEAAELVAQALGNAGIVARPGFYPHDEFGYGAAPGLWHFQDTGARRLVAGAAPEGEEST